MLRSSLKVFLVQNWMLFSVLIHAIKAIMLNDTSFEHCVRLPMLAPLVLFRQ